MKHFLILVMVVVLVGSLAAVVLGADEVLSCTTDPEDGSGLPVCSTRADNECYEGGSMAGKCDNEWLWKAGWEIARLNDGRITIEEVNLEWRFLVPPPAEPVASSSGGQSVSYAGCYNAVESFFDITYSGAPNVAGNISLHALSYDGTCSTPVSDNTVAVTAVSEAEARTACQGFGRPLGFELPMEIYWPGLAGSGLWVCGN